jgi:hypothetical protein
MLKRGRTSVTDEVRSCRRSTSTNEQIRALILDNRGVDYRRSGKPIADKPRFCHEIIRDRLHFHEICAIWVPEQLREHNRRNSFETCNHMLRLYHEEGDYFLRRIVTVVKNKLKSQPTVEKLMLTLF